MRVTTWRCHCHRLHDATLPRGGDGAVGRKGTVASLATPGRFLPVYRLVYHGKRFLPPTTASDFFTQKRNPLKWRVLADIVW
jgi:hypothetical protein